MQNLLTPYLPGALTALLYLAELSLRLVPLLFAAVFLAEAFRLRLGEERLRRILSGSSPWNGRLRAAALGAVLPFCECGAFPVLLGLLRAGVPLGTVLTFFLISPVVSLPAFLILLGFFGPVLALYYLGITILAALAGSLILELSGKRWGVFNAGFRAAGEPCSCAAVGEGSGTPAEGGSAADAVRVGSCCAGDCAASASLAQNGLPGLARAAWQNTRPVMKRILPYAAAAMILASLLHTFLPVELVEKVLAAGAPYDVLIAALAGIPLYAGDCTMIAAVAPLIGATGAVGAGIAFIISGAGTSINGLVFMSAIFRRRFLAVYLVTVLTIAIVSGYTLAALIR